MNAKDIVELIKAEKPGLLGKMPEKKAAALIRNAFIQLGKQIESADAGNVVRVRGLGNFRVKQVERETDGKTTSEKRVVFRNKPLKKKIQRAQ